MIFTDIIEYYERLGYSAEVSRKMARKVRNISRNPISNGRFCMVCEKPHHPERHIPHAAACGDCSDYAAKISRKAHYAVARAIKLGKLPKAKTCICVDCGVPATMYEHRDYSKPLDVQPVCWRCNSRRGVAKYPLPNSLVLPDGS